MVSSTERFQIRHLVCGDAQDLRLGPHVGHRGLSARTVIHICLSDFLIHIN